VDATQQSTPPQLFDAFEAGEITRGQLHAALRWHHLRLLDEVEEAVAHPHATWFEGLIAKRVAARWVGRHGSRRIRLILAALSRVPDFEPAHWLWNALHPDVPVHCFFRPRHEPVFRLLRVNHTHGGIHVGVEHGHKHDGLERDDFLLRHHGTQFLAERLDRQPHG